jgi:hypothetical protein
MIPSRVLRFSDVFSETFAITTRTFLRYLLFFAVCIVPATWLMTEGTIDATTASFRIAQNRYSFTDQDLTALRNRVRDSLEQNNPAFRQEIQSLQEDRASSDSASIDSLIARIAARPRVHFTTILADNLADIMSSAAVFFIGGILWFIGLCILIPSLTELSVQAFEERRQRLGYTLKRVFTHHLWTVLGIMALFWLASFALWVLSLALGQIRDVGVLFMAAIFVVWSFFTLGFSLAIPASVSENLGPIAAFRRSWQLTKHEKWRIFGVTLALFLISIPIWLFLSVVTSAAFMGVSVEFWRHALRDPMITVNWLLNGFRQLMESGTIANDIVALFVTPLPIVLAVVLYYDLRTRRDGPLTYDEPEPAPQTPLWQP